MQFFTTNCCGECHTGRPPRLLHVTAWLARYYRCRTCGHMWTVTVEDEVLAMYARIQDVTRRIKPPPVGG